MRNISDNDNLEIPSEIVSIIFMFYFIKLFNIEYGKEIKVKENIIKNAYYYGYNTYSNTTVIGDWMNPNSDNNNNHVYTIKVKIIKKSGLIIIGIVDQTYNLYKLTTQLQGYSFASNGEFQKMRHLKGLADKYKKGDIVSLTLDIKALSLSYSIIKNVHLEFDFDVDR